MASTNALLAERLAAEFGLTGGEPDAPVSEAELELKKIFREQPPTLDEFLYEPQYLNLAENGVVLSEKQYDLIRHAEQVLFPDTYGLMAQVWGDYWTPVRYVNEIVAEWGKGGGKDTVCQAAFARIANILLCLQSPQKYFGVPHNSPIHLLNVAATATQAHAAFFKPLRSFIVDSTWFSDKFESGEPPGEMALSIRFLRHIELVSGHSDADNLEGKNLIAAAADEISAFPTLAQAKGRGVLPSKTADGLVNMLRSSATSRYEQTYKLIQISFPRAKGDAIQQALAEAKTNEQEFGDIATHYASGPYATWDVNCRYDKYERIDMPGSRFGTIPNVPSYVQAYQKDPAECRAKYECAPEQSQNAFFKDKTALHAGFLLEKEKPPLAVSYYFGADRLSGEVINSWQVQFALNGLKPVPGALYCIHADMAINGDRAGLAMSHVSSYRTVETSDVQGNLRVEQRPVVKVDFTTAFEYDESAQTPAGEVVPREIQIRWYRKLVTTLANAGFVFGSVSMDGFQSADSLQIMKAQGYEARKVSVDRDTTCWTTLRDVIYDGRLAGYKHPLLLNELETLTKFSNGKIDHTAQGSKDIADALAACVTQAVTVGGQEERAVLGLQPPDGFSGMPARGHDDPFSLAREFSGEMPASGWNVYGREVGSQW